MEQSLIPIFHQLHLALNHFPIAGHVIGFFLLCFAVIKGNENFKTMACCLFLISALMIVPVYVAGDAIESAYESLPEKSTYVEEHEEIAEVALLAVLATGLLATVVLVTKHKYQSLHKKMVFGLVLVSLMATGAVLVTAHAGGEIAHPELRS